MASLGKAAVTFAPRASWARAQPSAFSCPASRRRRPLPTRNRARKERSPAPRQCSSWKMKWACGISPSASCAISATKCWRRPTATTRNASSHSSGATKIDLLLTDMVMPEISGRHFADWLTKPARRQKSFSFPVTSKNRSIPRDRRDPEMCFLAKPFNADELARKVREAAGSGSGNRESLNRRGPTSGSSQIDAHAVDEGNFSPAALQRFTIPALTTFHDIEEAADAHQRRRLRIALPEIDPAERAHRDGDLLQAR